MSRRMTQRVSQVSPPLWPPGDGANLTTALHGDDTMNDRPSLTAMHYLVLAAVARSSPSCPDEVALTLGLPIPLVRALVADLELAEMIASGSEL